MFDVSKAGAGIPPYVVIAGQSQTFVYGLCLSDRAENLLQLSLKKVFTLFIPSSIISGDMENENLK
jgi:hypothetical protein